MRSAAEVARRIDASISAVIFSSNSVSTNKL
jgi:hypothetical protein